MEFKQLIKNKYFIISVLILIFGITLNNISSIYINNNYQELPILNDLLLDNLPYLQIHWLYDLFSILSIGGFTIYVLLKKQWERLPYILLLFGIISIIRGVFITLTPFGTPHDTMGLFNGTVFRSGVYPSGHTGNSFLAFLLVKDNWRWLFLLLSLCIMVTLILARGHYSIDIFSAVIFAFALFCFGEKYFKKFIIKE